MNGVVRRPVEHDPRHAAAVDVDVDVEEDGVGCGGGHSPPLSLSASPSFRIGIHQRADHALVRHTALPRLALEKIDAAARQRQRDLHIFLTRYQIGGRRQKIVDDTDTADFTRGVFNGSAAHRFSFISANSPRRRCECGQTDR